MYIHMYLKGVNGGMGLLQQVFMCGTYGSILLSAYTLISITKLLD